MTVSSVQSVSVQALSVTVTSARAQAQAPATPRADSKADRLLGALDADGDGAITKDEFTTGAQALLRQAGARHRTERGDDNGRHEARSLRRLERKLERAFERVDADGDGAIDTQELSDAFSAIERGSRGRRESENETSSTPTAAPDRRPGAAGTPSSPVAAPDRRPAAAETTLAPIAAPESRPESGQAGVTTFQFTFVAVAIQRYTAVQPTPGRGDVVRSESDVAHPPADPVARPDDSTHAIVASPAPRPTGTPGVLAA